MGRGRAKPDDTNGAQKIVVCPGSFDPIHRGHCNIIERAAQVFDKVIVAVSDNYDKEHSIDSRGRARLAATATAHLENVVVEELKAGLLVDFCVARHAVGIVKGLRQQQDAGYELPMAAVNYELKQIETFFLGALPEYSRISSSIIRQLCRYGADITPYVPQGMAAAVESYLLKKI